MTNQTTNEHEPPISPLLEPSPELESSKNSLNRIRESDYGDREDVLADAEELNREMGSLDPTEYNYHYPPSSKRSNQRGSNSTSKRIINALSLGLRKHRSKFRLVIFLLIIWPLLCWMIIHYFFSNHPALFPSSLRNSTSTLFVVAHPDDECLFFAPTILASLQRAHTHGALLVMSSGNHYGQGDLRRKELLGSCKQLGIREDRCDVLNISEIQDDPKQWWPIDKIMDKVDDHIKRWMIDSIVTFDSYGVSGHINHRAVSAATTQLVLSLHQNSTNASNPPKSIKLFTIKSAFALRKYIGLYDLPMSFLRFIPSIIFGPFQQEINSSVLKSIEYNATTEESAKKSEVARSLKVNQLESGLLISGLSGYFSARKAFWSHQTQIVWDRHLYMILSQYMYFNHIERII